MGVKITNFRFTSLISSGIVIILVGFFLFVRPAFAEIYSPVDNCKGSYGHQGQGCNTNDGCTCDHVDGATVTANCKKDAGSCTGTCYCTIYYDNLTTAASSCSGWGSCSADGWQEQFCDRGGCSPSTPENCSYQVRTCTPDPGPTGSGGPGGTPAPTDIPPLYTGTIIVLGRNFTPT